MISFRYVPVVCVLVALALVPTLIHSYSAEPTHAGWNPSVIPDVLEGFVAAPSDRNPTWGKRRFDSDEWLEREYNSGRDGVRLTIIRSFDHKALYHHPELAVAYGPRFGSSFEKYEVVRFEPRPHIPVHVMHPAPGESAMA